jgi:signal transduction histidine kinase
MDVLVGQENGQRGIWLHVRQIDDKMLEVRVCDNGPGIPDGQFERLFEPFFTTKKTGMGMGLPVSKTIIEAHKGKLWAENRPEGGACFCFTVPIAG